MNLQRYFYILYGLGASNSAVKKYFDLNHFSYTIYIDGMKNFNYQVLSLDKIIIIKSPGISNDTSFVKLAISKKIKIWTDINLYYLLFPTKKYIAVTGTAGKTSCVLLLDKLLDDYEAVGNIGVPIFNSKKDNLIVECSSFQLEYAPDFCPQVFVILNIYPHHLNHHNKMSNYIKAKLLPTKKMKEDKLIIYGYDCMELRTRLADRGIGYSFDKKGDLYFDDDTIIFNNQQYPVNSSINPLYRNLYLVAFPILKYLNKEIEEAKFNAFTLPHLRCEIIYQTNNLLIVNDSKSTCIDATNFAIRKFNQYITEKSVLILGGKTDKEELNNAKFNFLNFKKFYLFGENKNILAKIIKNNVSNIYIKKYKNIEKLIKDIDKDCDFILFSPGAQSLDQFTSFEKRGEVFNNLIHTKYK